MPRMTSRRRPTVLALLAVPALVAGCASGPHPSLEVASRELDCPVAQLTRDEIYPNKQRISGCEREAIFVKDCGGYGTDAGCRWAKLKPRP